MRAAAQRPLCGCTPGTSPREHSCSSKSSDNSNSNRNSSHNSNSNCTISSSSAGSCLLQRHGTSPWNYGRTAAKQRKQRKGIMLMASNEVCTAGSVKRKGSAPAHLDEVAALRSTHLAVGLRDAAVMAHPQAQRAGVVSGTSPRTTWTPMAPCLVVAEAIEAALGGS